MAKDLLCKLCETDPEGGEIAVRLISDLTGSGELPLPIGPRCLPSFFLGSLQAMGMADPSLASELCSDLLDVIANVSAQWPGEAATMETPSGEPESPGEAPQRPQEPAEAAPAPDHQDDDEEAAEVENLPTGPSRDESSAEAELAAAGKGSRPARSTGPKTRS